MTRRIVDHETTLIPLMMAVADAPDWMARMWIFAHAPSRRANVEFGRNSCCDAEEVATEFATDVATLRAGGALHVCQDCGVPIAPAWFTTPTHASTSTVCAECWTKYPAPVHVRFERSETWGT
ncbi:MAG: hypothetical protein IT341_06870 [Chloroflexi bacterium]|nr:hypothetical protein [Chloroflexota bacterium]